MLLFQLGYILEVIKTGKCPPFPLLGCMHVTWFLTLAQFLGQGAWEGVVEKGSHGDFTMREETLSGPSLGLIP